MWPNTRRMAAAPADEEIEFISRRHDRAFSHRELSDRQARHVVDAIDFGNAETVHHAVLDHGEATGAAFFGRLEQKGHRAAEIAGLRQILRRAEQHGGVSVMAAGMRLARILRGPFHAARFGNGQRIHVGAQGDCRAVAVPSLYDADHAGAADAGFHMIATEGCELFGLAREFE